MHKEIALRLVEALESGRFEQGFGSCRKVMRDENGNETVCHCVLGVLCEVYLEDHPRVRWRMFDRSFGEELYTVSPEGESSILPRTMRPWSGIDCGFDGLMGKNDRDKKDFDTIAQELRQEHGL